jgi:hypothetical protein
LRDEKREAPFKSLKALKSPKNKTPFPNVGKIREKSSNPWKKYFQGLENGSAL